MPEQVQSVARTPLMQRGWWAAIALAVTFLSGGFAGAVFNYYVNRPKTTFVTYRTTTTTLASPDAAGLIPNLNLTVGGAPIQSLYSHDIEFGVREGPFIDQVEIAVVFADGKNVYGSKVYAPSMVHSIVCTPSANVFRCKLGPLSTKLPGPYRLTIASDQREAPAVQMAAKNADLVPAETAKEGNPQWVSSSSIAATIFAFMGLLSAWLGVLERSRRQEALLGESLHLTRQLEEEWDAVADFSITANPSVTWSYGWCRSALGVNDFVRHTKREVDFIPGADRWCSPEEEANMGVAHNRTAHVIPGNPLTYTIPVDMLHMHPGKNGIYDVVRWKCPLSGQYRIQGRFSGLDIQTQIADTDVEIVVNSETTLLSPGIDSPRHVLHGAGTEIPFDFPNIQLNDGDTVDFIVGVGPSGNYCNDSTGLLAKLHLTGR